MKQIISLAAYWIVIMFGLLLPLFENRIKNKKRFLYTLAIVIPVALSFRGIGFDLATYQGIYEYGVDSLHSVFSLSSLEPYFSLEIFIMRKLDLSFSAFLFVNLFIPLFIIAHVLGKYEKHPISCYGIFLAYQIFNFDVIRSFFSWAVYLYLLYHYDYIRSKIFLLLNVFVHYSQIVTCLFWPALKLKISRYMYIIIALFSVIVTFCFGPIIIKMIVNADVLDNFIIMGKLRSYLLSYELEVNVYLNQLHKIMENSIFFINFLFSVSSILFSLSKHRLTELERRLINSQIYGSILMIVFCGVGAVTLGNRLNKNFGIGMFVLYQHYFFGNKRENQKYYFIFMGLVIFYNLILSLYYAGIYNPNSMIYHIFS